MPLYLLPDRRYTNTWKQFSFWQQSETFYNWIIQTWVSKLCVFLPVQDPTSQYMYAHATVHHFSMHQNVQLSDNSMKDCHVTLLATVEILFFSFFFDISTICEQLRAKCPTFLHVWHFLVSTLPFSWLSTPCTSRHHPGQLAFQLLQSHFSSPWPRSWLGYKNGNADALSQGTPQTWYDNWALICPGKEGHFGIQLSTEDPRQGSTGEEREEH